MRIDVVTLFPGMVEPVLAASMLGRARARGRVDIRVVDLRDYAEGKRRVTDDYQFGGGGGMVLKPEPLFEAVESVLGRSAGDAAKQHRPDPGTAIVLMSAAGKLFDQEMARRYSRLERIILICGRYEGVDERVAEHLATEEVSIGDFVLSGGELPAMLVVDAVTRLLPGALGNEASSQNESFSEFEAGTPKGPFVRAPSQTDTGKAGNTTNSAARGQVRALLDFPHYTRPADYRGWRVPETLLSGNHREVIKWRQQKAQEKTRRNRPDLLGE